MDYSTGSKVYRVLAPSSGSNIAPSSIFHKTPAGTLIVIEKDVKELDDGESYVAVAPNVRSNLIRLGRTDLISVWDESPITPDDME